MNEVTDILQVLATMAEKITLLENKVQVLEKDNAALRFKNHQLEMGNSRLCERLSKYETPKKDSHNSSIPPSKEDLSSQHIRRTQSLREKSGKSTGGQKGHQGHSLTFSREPDKVETHASFYCPDCGKDLSEQTEILLEERWSIDIPPVIPQLTKHRIVGKYCSCGCLAKGQAPSCVKGFVSYGSNLKAIVSYLNTEHHIPYKRLCELLKDLFSLHISEGTIHNLLQSLKLSGSAMHQQIRQRIESSPVVGADETGCNINGNLHWHWSFQTDKLTYIYPDKSRGKTAIEKHFPNGLPHSYLVTDRHSSYFKMDVKGHQICIAHLLRELTYLHELEPQAYWPVEMKQLLQDAIHKRKTIQWNLIDRQAILQKFEKLLFCCTKELNGAIGSLQNSLIKHRENVFRFLFNPDIPYDNNASERSIRPLKLKQKVSGGFRSDKGAVAYAVIHSIADTAKKNRQSPFLALKAIALNT